MRIDTPASGKNTSLPKVSIITPSYNQVRFLEQTILSVLHQNYPNIEYIVIDGGSTDGSVEIIKKYENHIDYWISEPDGGQSQAINKGMLQATGDIVAWLNSDDLYFPNAVSQAVEEFRRKPDLALFYGNCVFIDEHGKFIRYFTEVECWNEDRLRNYTDFIMQPTTFFSRAKLNLAGFLDETLHFGMDWDLWCRLASTGEVCYKNVIIAANRDYKETKTNSGSWARLRELLTINIRHMTGIWPHAFFGFCGTEFRQKADAARHPAARFGYRLLGFVLMAMSPGAVLQYKRTRHSRNLYGIRHHSGIVAEGAATVHLPIVEYTRALAVVVRAEPGGVIEIHYDGETKHFPVNGSPLAEMLPLKKRSVQNPHLEVQLTFRNGNGTLVPGEIITIGLVH
ncbi:MAG: glycosyltransferase family 2 protein [Gammaproteobacteria bacterium]